MAEINIYQNPGQSLANIYKGFARQCNPGFVFPEAQTIEAWDIPLKRAETSAKRTSSIRRCLPKN